MNRTDVSNRKSAGWRRRLRDTARRSTHGDQRRDESGAVLVLALIFLVAVALVVGALEDWATNDVTNTQDFNQARAVQFAARSAVELGIQNIRYTPLLNLGQTLNANPPSYCYANGGSADSLTIGGVSVQVWCSTVWSPTSAQTRVVTLSACQNTVSTPNGNVAATAALCAQYPVLQTVVTFDDYPPGINVPTTAQCVVYCGNSLSINSWNWSPVIPTVTAISPTSGSITSSTTITITGAGFTTKSSVNLVDELGGTPLPLNVVLSVPASSVTYVSPTQISAVVPGAITGTTYFVTVTTPSGTSAYSTNGVFTYNPVTPTVTAITPSTASTAGGATVAISGSGFMTGATVNFTEESGGSIVTPTVVVPATSVSVLSPSSLTATVPAVTAGSTYYVTVTTATGTSANSSKSVFTYVPLQPIVSSLSVSSGPMTGGTGLTIIGSNFVAGATVNFVKESGGTVSNPLVSVPAAALTVTGSTTINVTTPAVTSGTTYFVTVTTVGGTSAYGQVFLY